MQDYQLAELILKEIHHALGPDYSLIYDCIDEKARQKNGWSRFSLTYKDYKTPYGCLVYLPKGIFRIQEIGSYNLHDPNSIALATKDLAELPKC